MMKSCRPSSAILLVLYLTTSTLILVSTSSSFVVVDAASSTTHRRNDDNNEHHPQSKSNDPIRDGRLIYSFGDSVEQDVIFDFRLAYPPYNRKLLEQLLLLLPPQQQQQQMDEKMDTELEEEEDTVITKANEMEIAVSEEIVVNVNNNNNGINNTTSLQNRKSNNTNIVSMVDDGEDITTDDDQGNKNVGMVDDSALFSSPDNNINDDNDDDDDDDDNNDSGNNVTVNDSSVEKLITLTSSSSSLTSSSLLKTQQLAKDYLNTANVDGIMQREEQHEKKQSNHNVMTDKILDSSNDNIQLDTIITGDDEDDMSTSDTIVSYQSVDGIDGLPPPKLVRLDESVMEITFDELDFGLDGSSSSSIIQDIVQTEDDSTISSTSSSNNAKSNHHQSVIDGFIDDLTLSNVAHESLFDELELDATAANDDRLTTAMQQDGGGYEDNIISPTIIHSSSATSTSTVSSSSSSTSNAEANRQFVDGLDDIPKLFESVEVPDELDVGADGSSMQEVLVGQGIKILWKHVKNVSGGISTRLGWNKLGGGGGGSITKTADSVWRAMPWSNYGSSGKNEMEEEKSSLDYSLLLNDVTTTWNDDKVEETTREKWLNTKKLESFSLVRSPKVKKIWNYAQRKLVQTRHLLDIIVKLFEGEEDEDYYDETNESFLKSRLL